MKSQVTTPRTQPQMARRVMFASFLGTTIEWYDYFIYGLTAGLVFNQLFFPEFSPAAGTLAAFASFAVGFLARPLGGAISGHFGDKLGRKPMLIATLLVMGLSTMLIGLLPSFHTIGIMAPILLVVLRMVQGLGAGGEWSGAALLTAEHTSAGKRGLFGSTIQSGVACGSLLASGAIAVVTGVTSDATYAAWGWRVPFLLSIVLLAIAAVVRFAIEESADFTRIQNTDATARLPIVEAFRSHFKSIVIVTFAAGASQLVFYTVAVFSVSYAVTSLGMDGSRLLTFLAITNAVQMVALIVFGQLSDRLGRRKVIMTSTILMGVFTFPFFWLLDTRSGLLILLGMIFYVGILESAAYGPQAAFIPELFETRVRYSGSAIGYNLAAILGGTAPMLAILFVSITGGRTWLLALYIVTVCAVGAIATHLAKNILPQQGITPTPQSSTTDPSNLERPVQS